MMTCFFSRHLIFTFDEAEYICTLQEREISVNNSTMLQNNYLDETD